MKLDQIHVGQRLVLINPYSFSLVRPIHNGDSPWKSFRNLKLHLFEEMIVTKEHKVGEIGNCQLVFTGPLITTTQSRTEDYEIMINQWTSIYWMDHEQFEKTSRLQRFGWRMISKLPEFWRS